MCYDPRELRIQCIRACLRRGIVCVKRKTCKSQESKVRHRRNVEGWGGDQRLSDRRKVERGEEKREGEGGGDRTDRLECPLLTGDLNRGWLPSNLTWSRPCHAFALEPLPTEVLLDLVPRHVQLDLHDPRSGARVHEILVLRPLGSVAVTTKIHLQRSAWHKEQGC